MVTSQAVERTWIRTGGYGRLRGEWVKYLGLLIDKKSILEKPYLFPHNKISKTVGLIATLPHIVPTRTLLDTYRSLIAPCIILRLYMAMHGNSSKTLLNQILILSKKCPPSYILYSSKGAWNTLLPEWKTPTPGIPIL